MILKQFVFGISFIAVVGASEPDIIQSDQTLKESLIPVKTKPILTLVSPSLITTVDPTDTKGLFNVTDFGAVGNGIVDDTEAFEAAIQAASEYGTHKTRGSLYIPSGVYSLGALVIDEPISIHGAGINNTLLQLKKGVTSSLFTINTKYYSDDSTTDTSRVLFSNIKLVGNRVDETTKNDSHGIYCPKTPWDMSVRYSSSVDLSGIEILGFTGNGIFIDINRNWALMSNVIVRYCNNHGLLLKSYDSRISSSDFGMCGGVGIYQSGSGATAITGCNIYGNKIGLNIDFYVNSFVNVSQSSFDINNEYAIFIDSLGQNITHSITETRFTGNSASSSGRFSDVKISNSPGIMIESCYFLPGKQLPSYNLELINVSRAFWGNNYCVLEGDKSFTKAITNDFTKFIFSGVNDSYFGPKGGKDTISMVAKGREVLRASNLSTPVISALAPLRIEDKTPSITLFDTDGPLNDRKWRLDTSGSTLRLYSLNDTEDKTSLVFTAKHTNNVSTSFDFATPLKLPNYKKASLPSAETAGAGALIFVTDEIGGATPAYSDGKFWRRFGDKRVVA